MTENFKLIIPSVINIFMFITFHIFHKKGFRGAIAITNDS